MFCLLGHLEGVVGEGWLHITVSCKFRYKNHLAVIELKKT